MTIEEKKNDTTVELAISGRLDTLTSPQLEKSLEELLPGCEMLILDMDQLEYISSAGLRVLLKAQKKMNIQGSMKLVHVNDNVREVFDITGFLDILTIE